MYLQQDLVRQFIESDTSVERFSLVSEVIGAGVVLEVQGALEKARNQWSRNTTITRKEELDPLIQQLSRVNDNLKRLESERSPEVENAVVDSERLFSETVAIIGTNRLTVTVAPTSPSDLDRLLKEISAERAAAERELSTIRVLKRSPTALIVSRARY